MGSFGLGHERFNLIIPHISFPQAHIHGIFYAKFIPYKTGVTGGDFLIEDYFSWDKTVKPMVDKAIENSHHPFKNLPKLSSRIKKGLEDKHMTFAKEEFEGFITLLDKIVKLSTEEGT